MASSTAPGEAGSSYQIEQWSEEMDPGEITRKYLYVLVGDERSAVRSGKHLIEPRVISLGWDERVLHALERARDELIRKDEAVFDRIHGRYERASRQVKDTCKVKKTFASMVEGSRAAEILQYLKENTEIDDNHFSWACHKSYSAFSALNGSSAEESAKCVELFEHIKFDLLDHLNTKVAAPYKARYDDQCRKALASYIREIETMVPGIRALRDMCINLDSSFGGAEFRYRISERGLYPELKILECTLGNFDYELSQIVDWDLYSPRCWCIVQDVGLFYWAKLLDDCYDGIDKCVRACSHRKLGWKTGSYILLDQEDCKLVVKTNFGFGRSSYFYDQFSYMGVKLLRYEGIVLYVYAGLWEKIDATYIYKVEESSWKLCFDETAKIFNDIQVRGARLAIGDWLYTSLRNLLLLVRGLVDNNVFVGFSDLNKLNEYLSQHRELYARGEEYIAGLGQEEWDDEKAKVYADIDQIVSCCKLSRRRRLDPGRSCDLEFSEEGQRLLAKLLDEAGAGNPGISKDAILLWFELKRHLRRKFNELTDEDIDAAMREQAPSLSSLSDMSIRYLEGWNLVGFKIGKVTSLIALMPNIKQVEDLLLSESFIPQLIECCRAIANQAKSYDESEIAPELTRIEPKLQEAKKQLEKTTAELEEFDAKLVGGLFVSGEDKARKEELEGVCREWRGKVTDLEAEKRGLINQQNTIHAFTDRVRKLA